MRKLQNYILTLVTFYLLQSVCSEEEFSEDEEQETTVEKRLNTKAFLTTHNSFANMANGFLLSNHFESISEQLSDGARGFMLDTYYKDEDESSIFVNTDKGVYLFHNEEMSQVPGAGSSLIPLRLYNTLQIVVDFLKENPQEIVTIFLEDSTNVDQLRSELDLVSGLKDVLLDLDNDMTLNVTETKQWPLISDMIQFNKRLLIFSSKNHDNQKEKIGISYDRDYTKQNYWTLGGLGKDFGCDSRWDNGVYKPDESFKASPPLFLMSHFRDFASDLTAKADNIFENIWTRINRQCLSATGQYPNYLAVDYYSVPSYEARDVVAKLNDPNFPMPTRGTGCWKDTYGRGVGEPISTCESDEEKDGALCYPYCDAGYTGVGPVCWQDCPSEFRDDGMFCAKPAPYGRGAGYVLWDESDCEDDHPQGCEQNGLLYYPRCDPGFYASGCCICSPECQNGQTDIGVSCAKKSYGRGAGTPLICEAGLELDGALCYPYCDPGLNGVGPVCWQDCPEGYTNCGAVCVKNQGCEGLAIDTFETVIAVADRDATGLIYPSCNTG